MCAVDEPEGSGVRYAKMTSDETRRVLRDCIGRPARVVWNDETSEVVKIVSVDDEGFVFETIPPDEIRYYWIQFPEVSGVGDTEEP